MRFVTCLTPWLCLFLALGCNSKTPVASNQSEDGTSASPTQAGNPASQLIPVKRNVKDFPGNWAIVATAQRVDNYRWIVKFTRGDDGKLNGEFVDTTQDRDQPGGQSQLIGVSAQESTLHFVIKNEQVEYEFTGRLEGGIIRGTFMAGPKELILARLLPTDETSLEKFKAIGRPPGSNELDVLMKSKDVKPEDFLNFATEFRVSPLAQDIFGETLAAYVQLKVDEAKFRQLIDLYLDSARLWGERWEARAETAIAVNLINTRYLSALAIEHLDAAEKKMGADSGLMKDALKAYRDAASANVQMLELVNPNSSDEVRKKANEALTELVKSQPFNSEILNALAIYAESTGNIDLAMDYLSDICSLPLLEISVLRSRAGTPPNTPTPSEQLKKIWVQKHGNEDGYAAHLKENYQKKTDAYLNEILQKGPAVPPLDTGNKVTLVEEFTSMQSPPCVASELALTAISKAIPTSRLIVIRYHQHIPLPDGLGNQDSDGRGAFYEINATPTIIIDGIKTDRRFYSGPIQAATNAYEILRKSLDPLLATKSDVVFQVSTSLENGQLSASVEVSGISEELLPSCRLRMAIVENHVDIFLPTASNGVRDRQYIVRELLGGSNGIAPKKGELKYSTTMPLEDIQKNLSEYMTRYEAGTRKDLMPEMKPPVQGDLSLVAWVQNEVFDKTTQSKMVLQSVMVPIGGKNEVAAPAQSVPKSEAANPGSAPAVATGNQNDATKESSSTPAPPALPE